MNLNGAPGMNGHEVFHPRWSNHVRFLSLTGPYAVRGTLNFISGGGPQVEILVGRLSPEFDKIEGWLQATTNDRADFHPDLWIAGGEHSSVPAAIAGEEVAPGSAVSASLPEHTVFIWKDARSQNQVQIPGELFEACQVEPRGAALFDRHFAMHLRGGSFTATGPASAGLSRCRDSGRYSLSFVVTPESIGKLGVGTVLAVVDGNGEPRLAVDQNGRRLTLRFPPAESGTGRPHRIPIGELSGVRPHAVTLSYEPGELRIWFQGELIRKERTNLTSPVAWGDAELLFGADHVSGERWRGRIERVRLDDESAEKSEVTAGYRSLISDLATRRPLVQMKITGRVLQTTRVPTSESIAPYRRSLILHDVEVRQVAIGQLQDQRVLVARWGMLDGRPVKGAEPKAGETLELTLEPMAGHPELESERQLMETDDLELPVFLDIGQALELE